MPTVTAGPSGIPAKFGRTVPLPTKPYAPATFWTVHPMAGASCESRAAALGAWTVMPTASTTRLLLSRNFCTRGRVRLMCIVTLLSMKGFVRGTWMPFDSARINPPSLVGSAYRCCQSTNVQPVASGRLAALAAFVSLPGSHGACFSVKVGYYSLCIRSWPLQPPGCQPAHFPEQRCRHEP